MARAPGAGRKRKPPESFSLNITSMMDMFTIILVFLLKSYSAGPQLAVTVSGDINLPVSKSGCELKLPTQPECRSNEPLVAVSVIVTQTNIIVDDAGRSEVVAKIEDYEKGLIEGVEDNSLGIPTLIEHLTSLRKAQENVNQYRDDSEFKDNVLVQADEKLQFKILKKVLYSIGNAEFGEFKFITLSEQ